MGMYACVCVCVRRGLRGGGRCRSFLLILHFKCSLSSFFACETVMTVCTLPRFHARNTYTDGREKKRKREKETYTPHPHTHTHTHPKANEQGERQSDSPTRAKGKNNTKNKEVPRFPGRERKQGKPKQRGNQNTHR